MAHRTDTVNGTEPATSPEEKAQSVTLGFTAVIANLIRELIIMEALPEKTGLIVLAEADHHPLELGIETSIEGLKTVEEIRKVFLASSMDFRHYLSLNFVEPKAG